MSSATQAGIAAELDLVMVFGFFTCFLTVVCLIYRKEFRTRLPLLAILLSASAVYGILAGVWPLGFVMIVLATAEIRRWRAISSVDPHLGLHGVLRSIHRPLVDNSRLSRWLDN